MKTSSLLHGLAALVLLMSAQFVHAEYIACPAKTQWKVSTPLPDPWSATLQEAAPKAQFTVLINTVEWLVCPYAHDDNEPGVYTYNGWYFSASIKRPAPKDLLPSQVSCPLEQITTEVVSPVPAPWKSTKYVWKRQGDPKLTSIGGQSVIVCTYTAPMDSQKVGPTSLLQPLNLGDDKPLASAPKPGPQLPGNLAAKFAVLNASLATVPAPQRRACPAQVNFQGSIETNGPGDVIYRTVDNKGNAGPQQKLRFVQAGTKPVALQIQVSPPVPPAQSDIGSLAVAPQSAGPAFASGSNGSSGPALDGSLAEATTPGKLGGFMRIEILAPTAGKTKSQDAAWSVQCVAVNVQPGATNLKPQSTGPAPSAPLAKSPVVKLPAVKAPLKNQGRP